MVGGRWLQYNKDIQDWLSVHYYNDDATKNIGEVIFTGVIDGSNSNDKKYARAYGSIFNQNSKSAVEKKIEAALQFDGNIGEKPAIKILAMNVGYKEPLDTEKDGKEEKKDTAANTSSIVLRIEGKASFTITGDADGCTWDFIEGSHQGDTSALKTDYLLLSHHGALRHGPSRESILDILKPKVCLISTGRIGTPYYHPRGEIIDRLIQLGTLEKFKTAYPFSYYKDTNGNGIPDRKRKYYKEMICSTLDDGHITFKLMPPAEIDNVYVTRNRKEFLTKASDQDIFFKREEDDNEVIEYNPNSSARKEGSLQKVVKKINKEEKNTVKYFTKHSSQYNLILPELKDFEIEDDDVFYLKDLAKNEVYKIIIDQ